MNSLAGKRYFSLAVFTLILGFFICSLPQRLPNEDEAFIAGHAYFYDQLGFVKSDLDGGYLEGEYSWDKRQYFYHKLFVLTGVLFNKISLLFSFPEHRLSQYW